jgi:hypothetical protein
MDVLLVGDIFLPSIEETKSHGFFGMQKVGRTVAQKRFM